MVSKSTPTTFGDARPSTWPGERLGFPESGPGSVARIGRRLVAIMIDWALASGISAAFFSYSPGATLGVFATLQVVFIPTIGGSLGHRLVGLHVVALGGGWVGPWRPAVRTLLLVVVIPALVWDSDQRGFHDTVAGTVLVKAVRPRFSSRPQRAR